jgi:hypothetical protein
MPDPAAGQPVFKLVILRLKAISCYCALNL